MRRLQRESLGVRARAPLRLGFAGGGTDLAPFCDTHGGAVMNAAIGLFAYAHLSPRNDGHVQFEAAEIGEYHIGPADPVIDGRAVGAPLLHAGVYNRIVRDFNNGRPLPVTLTTTVDAPAGSGLGGSSTLVVAMLDAFRTYLGLPLGEYDIARLAFEIERVDLGLAGGRQDQFAAAYGGFNFMEFHAGDRTIVNPLRIHADVVHELESALVLYFTGASRESAAIIKTQQAGLAAMSDTAINAMLQLKREAVEAKEALLEGDLRAFGATLKRGWEAKKATSSAISNPEIERIIALAEAHGAFAAKVSGAGGGGFIMLLVDPERRMQLVTRLAEEPGRVLACRFMDKGAESWRRLV
jgi:D-glycero-alpha-D-manno-heptose-7-phosphate kinase